MIGRETGERGKHDVLAFTGLSFWKGCSAQGNADPMAQRGRGGNPGIWQVLAADQLETALLLPEMASVPPS